MIESNPSKDRVNALITEVEAVMAGEHGSDWADHFGPLFALVEAAKQPDETPAKPARPRIEAPPSPTVADLIAFYADEHFETKGVTVSIPYRATRLALEDAARYRWLRDQPHADIAACWLLPNDVDANSPEELDAAIDKALGRVKCTCGRYTEDEKFFQLRDSRGGLHYTDRPCITPTTGEQHGE